ncbi:MAG: hypothetical protein ACPG8O_03940, partial [Alcanivorax nanhaiticus]
MNRLTVLTTKMKTLSLLVAGAPLLRKTLGISALGLAVGLSAPLQAQEASEEAAAEKPAKAQVRETAPLGEAVERQLPLYMDYQTWVQDPSRYEQNLGDRIETQTEEVENLKTIKLTNVVPPIRYQSGVSEIPADYVERLRGVLDGMKGRLNVRLHFVGHSDNVPLFGALRARLGDNTGLSRERAGAAAEYFQV